MSYYDGEPQTIDSENSALEAPGGADESPEGGLGDGAIGKFCLMEGKYKSSCQSCPGIVCNLVKW
jgi:hypothetical protein